MVFLPCIVQMDYLLNILIDIMINGCTNYPGIRLISLTLRLSNGRFQEFNGMRAGIDSNPDTERDGPVSRPVSCGEVGQDGYLNRL